jgi:hypothetical protein
MAKRTATYSNTSPYARTNMYRSGLDVMQHRPISRYSSDTLYLITQEFNYRPDLLAYKLYGSSSLWWVFAARNPSALKDPTFHFVAGNRIYLPTKQTLTADLGI